MDGRATMSQRSGPLETAEQHVREIRRRTRTKHSTGEKIWIRDYKLNDADAAVLHWRSGVPDR